MNAALCQTLFPARDYDLAATLLCGQAFRWVQRDGAWEGVIGSRWVRLRQVPEGIAAEAVEEGEIAGASRPLTPALSPSDGERESHRPPILKPAAPGSFHEQDVCSPAFRRPGGFEPAKAGTTNWRWLAHYLQTDVEMKRVLASFPDDAPMREAVAACCGLRLLRQEPWECLASFILSTTKQIAQIRQVIARLCGRFGEPVPVPPGHAPAFAFPSAARVAAGSEAELRECKMGFRAPNLRRAACMVATGEVDLVHLGELPVDAARQALLELPGVGRKVADCVLLFAYGFPTAFPVDVWIEKALRQLYFPRRRPSPRRLREFAETHFGPHAGYAQQYLFHHIRRTAGRNLNAEAGLARTKAIPAMRVGLVPSLENDSVLHDFVVRPNNKIMEDKIVKKDQN